MVRRGRYFSVKVFESSLPYSRFGVVLSKQVSKTAVRRVALKRLIYMQLHALPKTLSPMRDVVIVVSATASIDQKDAMIRELLHLIHS